jgi:uncharacterized protein (DUF1330 family)
MSAYLIVETEIHDPEQYERYNEASPGAVAAGGGRFLARGGELAVLEGDWHPKRLVVLEFENSHDGPRPLGHGPLPLCGRGALRLPRAP